MNVSATPSTSTPAEQINAHLLHTVGVAPEHASPSDLMQATAQVARAQLSRRWVATQAQEREQKARRVVYLSMEFLMGRSLSNALAALNLTEGAAAGLAQHAKKLEDVAEFERDAALGVRLESRGFGRQFVVARQQLRERIPSIGARLRLAFLAGGDALDPHGGVGDGAATGVGDQSRKAGCECLPERGVGSENQYCDQQHSRHNGRENYPHSRTP